MWRIPSFRSIMVLCRPDLFLHSCQKGTCGTAALQLLLWNIAFAQLRCRLAVYSTESVDKCEENCGASLCDPSEAAAFQCLHKKRANFLTD